MLRLVLDVMPRKRQRISLRDGIPTFLIGRTEHYHSDLSTAAAKSTTDVRLAGTLCFPADTDMWNMEANMMRSHIDVR
jgi:hypothetical protein